MYRNGLRYFLPSLRFHLTFFITLQSIDGSEEPHCGSVARP